MANSKTNLFISLSFALITFLALNFSICAQGIKIKQEDFAAAHRKVFEQLKGKPHRITVKSVTRLERSTSTFENVNEIIPPDKNRFLSKAYAEPRNSGAEFTMEIIEIGQKRFNRKDNGVWTETNIAPKSENKIQSDKPQTEKIIDHYFLGETALDGKPADLYQRLIRDKFKTKQPSGEDKETLVLIKTKFWFGKTGLWIREESEYEFSDAATNKVMHTQQMINIYEYAPNIKIEAPKIN